MKLLTLAQLAVLVCRAFLYLFLPFRIQFALSVIYCVTCFWHPPTRTTHLFVKLGKPMQLAGVKICHQPDYVACEDQDDIHDIIQLSAMNEHQKPDRPTRNFPGACQEPTA